jgi:ABC-type antimicrobial peptide transport system permease subunit
MTFLHVTRSKVIQVWFAAVLLVTVGGIALGITVTIGTAALLLAMCLVPPAVVVMLWPSDKASTISEAIHDAKSR